VKGTSRIVHQCHTPPEFSPPPPPCAILNIVSHSNRFSLLPATGLLLGCLLGGCSRDEVSNSQPQDLTSLVEATTRAKGPQLQVIVPRLKTAISIKHPEAIEQLLFSTDGSTLVAVAKSSGNWHSIEFFDAATLRRRRVLTTHFDPASPAMAVAPDGSMLAWRQPDGTISLFNLGNGTTRSLATVQAPVTEIAFSPNSRHLAAAASPITVWEVATSKVLRTIANSDNWMGFSPDGRFLVTAYRPAPTAPPDEAAAVNATVKLWHLRTGGLQREFSATGGLHAPVAFSLNGQRLASTNVDLAVPRDKKPAANKVAAPSGSHARDATLKNAFPANKIVMLSDIRTRATYRLSGHYPVANNVFFSPDSRFLYVNNTDGYAVDSGQLVMKHYKSDQGEPLFKGTTCETLSPNGRFMAGYQDARQSFTGSGALVLWQVLGIPGGNAQVQPSATAEPYSIDRYNRDDLWSEPVSNNAPVEKGVK